MSGYLYGLVGQVLKYFKKGKRQSRNSATIGFVTPPRENRKQKPEKDGSPEDRDVWKTPEGALKRQKSVPLLSDPCLMRGVGFMPMDSGMFYGPGSGGEFVPPLERSWFDFPEESNEYLRYLEPRPGTPFPNLRLPSSCLKRSQSMEMRPPAPLLTANEWKTAYDAFHARPQLQEEDILKRGPSKIPKQSGRRVSLEDTRRGQTKKPTTGPCTCRRYTLDSSSRSQGLLRQGVRFDHSACGDGANSFPKTLIAHRSQLNAKLEHMFRFVSKKKYCGNIIDSTSHGRWMKLAGIEEDEDASSFKKYAKGRVALTVSQYKIALQKMCEDHGLDYWNVLQKMTDVPLGNEDANTLTPA